MKNYKLSYYVIITDPIINNKFQIVYSTRTTSKVLLNIEVVSNIRNNNFDLVSSETFLQLINLKIIVDKNENELKNIVLNNNIAIDNNDELYYVIQPSADCQLGCNYCGQIHTKKSINNTLYDKICDRITGKLDKSNNYKKLKLGWFGGEPLMGLTKIKQLTPKLKEIANQYNCSYSASMTTNGLSLKKNIFFDLSRNYDVKEFDITLDGSKESHDNRRHTKTGEKTFDIILNNISDILNDIDYKSSDAKIIIRSNIDKRNKESIFELIDILEEKDILKKIHAFYIAPIHSWGNDAHLMSLSKEEYAKLEMDFYIKLLEKGKAFSSLLPNSLKQIVCLAVQKDGELIDSSGDIYNCTEISQVPEYEKDVNIYKIDNLNNTNEPFLKERPLSNWNNDVLEGKFPCSTCSILPICGGACPKLWYENISPCPILKYNIKDRLIFDFHVDYKRKNN